MGPTRPWPEQSIRVGTLSETTERVRAARRACSRGHAGGRLFLLRTTRTSPSLSRAVTRPALLQGDCWADFAVPLDTGVGMPPLAHRRGCKSGTLPRSVVAGTAVAFEPGVHD